ncbi:MAG: DUF1844 domain-containing protein [Nesterenkonia sp.]|nr:DUF1844 domain-containing protein [Nesterenkonia sp.]
MESQQNSRPEAAREPADTVGADADEARQDQVREAVDQQSRDIAEVPAVELINTVCVHLMSAAAVKTGLADDDRADELQDLDEARKLITALAGLVTAAAPEVGGTHAAPLRDGLRSLQLAFREASSVPDAPGRGPGEKWTGPVS